MNTVIEDSEGNIIVGGLAYPNSHSGRYLNILVKLDKNGKIKWVKKNNNYFSGFYESVLKGMVPLDNGYFVVGGSINYIVNDSVNGNKMVYEACLIKIDSSGNLVNYKTYRYQNPNKKFDSTLFRDISKTEDGGFLGVGQILYDLGFEGRLNDWDMLVVKTDSNGCLVQGCDSLTFVTEWNAFSPIKNSIESIYPNPNSGIFSVNYSVSEQSTSKLLVFDLLGKLQKEILLNSYEKQKSMDLKGLKNGVYLLQLVVNEQLKNVKRVVIAR